METTKECQVCGATFFKKASHSRAAWANAKFCSRPCYWSAMSGNQRAVGHEQTAWNKGLEGYNAREKNANWTGDEITYGGLHQWLRVHYTKTGTCEECGLERRTQWANISGLYKRERSDFMELCHSCHKKRDLAEIEASRRCGDCGSANIISIRPDPRARKSVNFRARK